MGSSKIQSRLVWFRFQIIKDWWELIKLKDLCELLEWDQTPKVFPMNFLAFYFKTLTTDYANV